MMGNTDSGSANAPDHGPSRRSVLGALSAVPLAAGGLMAASSSAEASTTTASGAATASMASASSSTNLSSKAGPISKAGLRRLREVLAGHVESKRIPGLVALVSRGGQTHVEAMGTMRAEGGAPMRRDTIFRMASTTKPVSMAAAMVLLDECKIRLDDPVDQWLPELADRRVLKNLHGPLTDTVPAERPITVRDLMTATFGLGIDPTVVGTPILAAMLERGLYPREGLPSLEPDEWMRRLGSFPLMYQPGQHWQYNISHDVLGVLVARVAKKPFETFLRERVFDPLGMKDTAFHVPAGKIERLPTLYSPDPATGKLVVWDEPVGGRWSKPPVFQSGGGGLVSTIDDYHAYFRMLLNGGVHNGQRVLSRPGVEMMTTNRMSPEETAYRAAQAKKYVHVSFGQGQHGGWGFGMAVRTYRADYASVGQFGWDGGAGTSTYGDPDKQLVGILLTQVGTTNPDSTRAILDFWSTLYQVIDD
ncbi:serine hydrolase domain-containing protein [Nonomuraea typhae]|uniref:Serine hydrolase domain-containing protein n=1 Tax=Nonomuraea typhae TaxID=2603600 RepID=A0ABW7Z5X5_9ACTN